MIAKSQSDSKIQSKIIKLAYFAIENSLQALNLAIGFLEVCWFFWIGRIWTFPSDVETAKYSPLGLIDMFKIAALNFSILFQTI